MPSDQERPYARLAPRLDAPESRAAFVRFARTLEALGTEELSPPDVDAVRREFLDEAATWLRQDRQSLMAAAMVLADLVTQGWSIDVTAKDDVELRPPPEIEGDVGAEKARVRKQELVKRDAQLAQPAVRKFVKSIERSRVATTGFVSIFSLMRDGRELAERLRVAREHPNAGDELRSVVDPYLQFVTDGVSCASTGLPLIDIWRYFRHTWTNQYTSVPGRSMLFIVRDRSCSGHPVVGIGALASPVMQIRERDAWIGWHPDSFLGQVRQQPDPGVIRWARGVVETAIEELEVSDLLEIPVMLAREIRSPNSAVIERLLGYALEQRALHHRFVRSRDHKQSEPMSSIEDHWRDRARSHLFRSKRAIALAELLECRLALNELPKVPTSDAVMAFAASNRGGGALRRALRKAKADRVGIALADISVCGAVQPYNAIVGGKLVAMLAASPEVVAEYARKYGGAESEIASSMAGRPIVRPAHLVFLGTTSLYGVGSSQYNRIRIPCDRIGGRLGEQIRFVELGRSEAFGTSQYSDDTVEALADLVQQSTGGQRVNSIFGEGVSPKLRKIRHGLDLLNLPAELLLKHFRRRVVYGVSLVRNLRSYLLGIDPDPDYLVDPGVGVSGSSAIAAWWRHRWLSSRIRSDIVLDEVARHTLVRPIRHGARVIPSDSEEQLELFGDD